MRRRDHVGHQAQHRRMHRVIQMGHRLVGAVDGQRVLHQVIGADRQEIKVFEEAAHHQRRRRHLDHGAHLQRAIGHSARVKFGAGHVELGERLLDLAHTREHGEQQVHRPVHRRTQNGAQLGAEHGGVRKAPADGAQAQRRVERRALAVPLLQRLVGANVDGANGHRRALHALQRLAVRSVLLVLVGQLAYAAHEQKLGAKQAHARRPAAQRGLAIGRTLDVGQQLNGLAVERDRRRVPQPRKALALQRHLALTKTVFFENDG
ncbi:hypothetical protein SDC9_107662 [bioreactor metagenome]|uniref:Uncharacterized protein n=1 Tax=bioreactor metagenome TaxID=1076179 RepID=A0A645B6Y1_9ZZZZ